MFYYRKYQAVSLKGVIGTIALSGLVGIPLAVNVMIATFSYGVVAVYSALYGDCLLYTSRCV